MEFLTEIVPGLFAVGTFFFWWSTHGNSVETRELMEVARLEISESRKEVATLLKAVDDMATVVGMNHVSCSVRLGERQRIRDAAERETDN